MTMEQRESRLQNSIVITDDTQVGMDMLSFFLLSSDSSKLSISTSSEEVLSARRSMINENVFTLEANTTYNNYVTQMQFFQCVHMIYVVITTTPQPPPLKAEKKINYKK